jgi:Zn-dependent protease
MQSGWRIGSLFGIPLLIDSSWFFILALVTFRYWSLWQQEDWGIDIAGIAGFAMALLLFGSVLLHELGHSLVALSQGIKVSSITLFLFGGIASIEEESRTPGKAFQVAIAGPAVSFALFIILALAQYGLPLNEPFNAITTDLAAINLVLAIFNMIPGLPLDGGQVLKAFVWKVSGSRITGVRWASRTGQWLGWAAILFSLYVFLTTFNPLVLWIALLGWFGVRNATAYSQITDLQEAILKLDASTAANNDYRVVDARLTLREFMDKYLLLDEERPPVFFAASAGRYRGLVSLEVLNQVERSAWETTTLQEIVQPLEDIPSVKESTPLAEVIDRLETDGLRVVTMLSPAGAVSGVIDRGDIVRAVAEKLKVPISEAVIRRIKEEGTFPPGLQLQAIARSAQD